MTEPRSRWRTILLLGLTSLVSLGVYLLVSWRTYRIGFPLDDAWIHQTYARNLAEGLGWVYTPGIPSGGSTSPAWTLLLALGDLFHLGPYVWTFLLGWLALWGTAWLGESAARGLAPDWNPRLPWVGLLITIEWHLVWASGSGMETLLFSLGITWILVSLLKADRPWFWLGLVCGLLTWVRPEGLTLLGPVGLCLLIPWQGIAPTWKRGLRLAGGFLLAVIPYLFFNQAVGGSIWPNTLSAKQTEYAALQQLPYLARLVAEAEVPLVGLGAVLLPGFILTLIKSIRGRSWGLLAGAVWWVGFLGLYAWRLPVTYQHGRYVIPVIPFFVICGAMGLIGWRREHTRLPWQRILGSSWALVCALIGLAFWGMAARSYAVDVATIETEMVEPAHWLEAHTTPQDVVAAHDIGALGYFCPRPLVDLAGLISPEIVPYLGDSAQLRAILDRDRVDYLILTFDWYPELRSGLTRLYCSQGGFAPAQGAANTCVYAWNKPD